MCGSREDGCWKGRAGHGWDLRPERRESYGRIGGVVIIIRFVIGLVDVVRSVGVVVVGGIKSRRNGYNGLKEKSFCHVPDHSDT